jgi:tetratricopeptide (TPR) repeat protein
VVEQRRNQRSGRPRGGNDDRSPRAGGRAREAPTGSRPSRPPRRQERPERPERPPAPPGLDRRADEPRLPADLDLSRLHRSVRAELRGLPKDLADLVAGHLLLAGELIDSDPEAAYRHAEAARRRAARLPVVREATAETAYAAERFDVALSEFRALRRMTGMPDYLPVMADCERALGRPQAAIKLAKEAHHVNLPPPLQVEMIIVEAGARADLGQSAEALRLLEEAVEAVQPRRAKQQSAVARLEYAYADALLRQGRADAARRWFASAAELDVDQSTDAAERRDELDGLIIDYDDAEPDGTHSADETRSDEAAPEAGR